MNWFDIKVGMRVTYNDGHGPAEDGYVARKYDNNPFVRIGVRNELGWRMRLAYPRELKRRD